MGTANSYSWTSNKKSGIAVFTVFRLLTDFVCLYNYEFWLSLCKIVRSSVILLLPLLSKQFIKKVNRGGIRFLDRIITTDESWFHYYDPETKQQSSQWKNCNSLPPKKAKITKSLGKNMFILFMDRKGMLLTRCSPWPDCQFCSISVH